MTEPRVLQAVRNSAAWYDTMCHTHACPGEFRDEIWINRHAYIVGDADDFVICSLPCRLCPHGNPDGGSVDIALIIQAVGYALTACPAH